MELELVEHPTPVHQQINCRQTMNHCWRPLSRRLNQSQGRCQRGWTVVGLTRQRQGGPRLRVQSVSETVLASSRASDSPTILDALEEDLEVSVSSTVPASSRALRRLRLVSGSARDEPTVQWG